MAESLKDKFLYNKNKATIEEAEIAYKTLDAVLNSINNTILKTCMAKDVWELVHEMNERMAKNKISFPVLFFADEVGHLGIMFKRPDIWPDKEFIKETA